MLYEPLFLLSVFLCLCYLVFISSSVFISCYVLFTCLFVFVFVNFLCLCIYVTLCLYRYVFYCCAVLYRLIAMLFWFLFNVGLCFLYCNVAYLSLPVTVLVLINVVPFFLFLCLSVCLFRIVPFCTVSYRDEAALIFLYV